MVGCANSAILDRGSLSLSYTEVREGERDGWDVGGEGDGAGGLWMSQKYQEKCDVDFLLRLTQAATVN